MTIGIDISSLQGPHRMRGIGYTLINLINGWPAKERQSLKLVLFAYPEADLGETFQLLDLEGVDYVVRDLQPAEKSGLTLPGLLRLLVALIDQLYVLKTAYFGDTRIKDLSDIDVFLQTDQAISLPRGRKIKKALVLYDLIPYVLEWDYMWGYKTARANGFTRRAALRCAARRRLFTHKTAVNCRRADFLFAISEATKHDFVRYIGVKPRRIRVMPLGVNKPADDKAVEPAHRYIATSWGYTKRPMPRMEKPFILFVGGADGRRKLEDIVTAFNHLRAQGQELKLVLAGDIMQGPENIPTPSIRQALNKSSYIDDIVFLGFISDEERDWLYRNALCFVFPSRYEGFGLPVLEAMSYGCPVISYRNTATVEVAGQAPVYADDYLGIQDSVLTLINDSAKRSRAIEQGVKQSSKYSWQKTSKQLFETLQK